MTSQLVKQTKAIIILLNIPRSKVKQTDNGIWSLNRIETFFLKNHTQNVVEKLALDSFLKNQN